MNSRKEIIDPSFGAIKISKINSNNLTFFAGGTGHQSGISIAFSNAKLVIGDTTNFGGKIFENQSLYTIRMSELQWANFLFNKNSETGTPCSIVGSETGVKKYDIYEAELNNNDNFQNKYQNLNKEFNKQLIAIFPEAKDLQVELKTIISKSSITNKENIRAKEIVSLFKEMFITRKSEVLDLIETFLDNADDLSKNIYLDNIKSNLLNFAPSSSLETAKNILTSAFNEIGALPLLENNKVEELPIEKHEGILVLRDVKREGFVEDENSTNGYSISLYQAKVSIVNGSKVITAGDLLFQCELSENQFSTFISSFNSHYVTSTNTFTEKLGFIPRSSINTQLSERKIELMLESFHNVEKRMLEAEKLINDSLTTNKITKEVKDKLNKELSNLDKALSSSLSFSMGLVFEDKEVEGTYKFRDVVASLRKGIEELGLKSFVEKIEQKNNHEFLISFFSKDNNKMLS